MRAVGFLAAFFAAVVLFYAAPGLPPIGDPGDPGTVHVSPRYIHDSLQDTDTPNVVTAVLADYRGYDTLGETTVILTAGLACLLILGTRKRKPLKARSRGRREP
ncbi:MAG: hydrogen gas-evolving membrane-bound hydrogenase subunit E [Elusimicrobiota bacterium]